MNTLAPQNKALPAAPKGRKAVLGLAACMTFGVGLAGCQSQSATESAQQSAYAAGSVVAAPAILAVGVGVVGTLTVADVVNRQELTVVDARGRPLIGVAVTAVNFGSFPTPNKLLGRTDGNGKIVISHFDNQGGLLIEAGGRRATVLFPQSFPATVWVEHWDADFASYPWVGRDIWLGEDPRAFGFPPAHESPMIDGGFTLTPDGQIKLKNPPTVGPTVPLDPELDSKSPKPQIPTP